MTDCKHNYTVPVDTTEGEDGDYVEHKRVIRLACTKCAITIDLLDKPNVNGIKHFKE